MTPTREAVIASIITRLKTYMDVVEDNNLAGSIAIEVHRDADGWRKAHVVLSQNWKLPS